MRCRLPAVTRTLLLLGPLAGCGAPPPPATAAAPPVATVTPGAATLSPAPAPAPAGSSAPASDDASLGQIDFPVTGSAECQQKFREGMLALDSFLYDQAHVSFAAAYAADPQHCAMASWGEAMAYDHPIWGERNLVKGRAALARVTGEDALTPKERAFLGVARALYKKDAGDDAHPDWLEAAAAMQHDFPDDDEVVLQHALALLSVYGYGADHVREQMQAGALALEVLGRHPQHPGAAHYVIHSFDNPEHAILALPAARTYARIAPSASHALHMPSHTFTALGMWREVVPSNERAYAASVAWEKSRGHSPSEYDWHAYSWLVAAHLELGQPGTARKLTDDAAALLVAAKDDTGQLRSAYESMVSDYVTQTGRWNEVEALVAPLFAPAYDEKGGMEGKGEVACAMHAPGGTGEQRGPAVLFARLDAQQLRAEAAIHLGDEATAVKRVADMKAVRAQMAPWQKTFSPGSAQRSEAYKDVLLARAHAAAKPSAAAQKKAIEALEKYEKLLTGRGGSGPVWDQTTNELLGDALLAEGKAKEALARFETDLANHPNRAMALLGAARAAKAAGDASKARGHYLALAELWKDADADLPALPEVRDGAK